MNFIIALSLCSSVLAFTSPRGTSPTGRAIVMVLNNDLWGQPPEKEGDNAEKSKALPFAPRPKLLDGTLAGDVGFEYVVTYPRQSPTHDISFLSVLLVLLGLTRLV